MMENLVNKIIEIDSMADQRLCDAESASEKLRENTEREAAGLKEDLRIKAEKRMSEIRKFHQDETREILAGIDKECNEKISQLDEAFNKQHLSIEDSIFRAIVGE